MMRLCLILACVTLLRVSATLTIFAIPQHANRRFRAAIFTRVCMRRGCNNRPVHQHCCQYALYPSLRLSCIFRKCYRGPAVFMRGALCKRQGNFPVRKLHQGNVILSDNSSYRNGDLGYACSWSCHHKTQQHRWTQSVCHRAFAAKVVQEV
jgi:hypothetical protein